MAGVERLTINNQKIALASCKNTRTINEAGEEDDDEEEEEEEEEGKPSQTNLGVVGHLGDLEENVGEVMDEVGERPALV